MNAIMQNFDKIFNASLIYATFRSATPIIFAALCAVVSNRLAGSENTDCASSCCSVFLAVS